MPEQKPGVVMTRLAATSSSWDGASLPAYPAGRPEVTVMRVVIPPRALLEMHAHPVINAGLVLRGELTVVAADGTTRTFAAGEAIVEMVGSAHFGENRGEDSVELVMFYAGAEGLPLSVKP